MEAATRVDGLSRRHGKALVPESGGAGARAAPADLPGHAGAKDGDVNAALSECAWARTAPERANDPARERSPDRLPWLVAAALAQTIVWLVVSMSTTVDTDETGALERVQLALLAAGALVFLAAGVRFAEGTQRVLALALALGLASCLLREMDPRAVGESRILKFTASDAGGFLVAPLWLVLLVFAVRAVRAVLECMRHWLHETSGRAFIAGCAFLSMSWVCDRGLLPLPLAVSWLCEELAELSGYLMFLASSVVFMVHARAAGRAPNGRATNG